MKRHEFFTTGLATLNIVLILRVVTQAQTLITFQRYGGKEALLFMAGAFMSFSLLLLFANCGDLISCLKTSDEEQYYEQILIRVAKKTITALSFFITAYSVQSFIIYR